MRLDVVGQEQVVVAEKQTNSALVASIAAPRCNSPWLSLRQSRNRSATRPGEAVHHLPHLPADAVADHQHLDRCQPSGRAPERIARSVWRHGRWSEQDRSRQVVMARLDETPR